MKNKKILYILFLVLLISSIIIGCEDRESTIVNLEDTNKTTQASVDYSPSFGGELVLPLTKFDSLNPLITENNYYYYFSKLIFESLFEFNNDLEVEKQLAESYSITDEGKTIIVELKDQIYWHDGQPLSADDVEFTIETIKLAGEDSLYKKMLNGLMGIYKPVDIRRIISVKKIDNQKVAISFDSAIANNLEVLTFPLIPKHIYASGKATSRDYYKALASEDYIPIGTGPFKFESYDKMKKIVLSANDDYREGRTYIDTIVGLVLDNEDSIITAFETGQINIGTTGNTDWDKYQNNDRIKILEFISRKYEFLAFNFSEEIFQEDRGRALRRAMAYGIDRQSIIEKLYLGHGTQTDVPIHPDSYLISSKSNTYGYNLDQARKELAGIDLEDKTFSLLTNTYSPERLKLAELIKEDLYKLGLDINIIPEIDASKKPSIEEIDRQWEEINLALEKGEFDLALLGWELSVIPDLSFAFHSSQIPNRTNFIKYNNEEMDSILELAFSDPNLDNKFKNYENIQGVIIEDLPYFSLFFKNKALLVDSKFVGNLNPSFFNIYKGIDKLYIPKDLQ